MLPLVSVFRGSTLPRARALEVCLKSGVATLKPSLFWKRVGRALLRLGRNKDRTFPFDEFIESVITAYT